MRKGKVPNQSISLQLRADDGSLFLSLNQNNLITKEVTKLLCKSKGPKGDAQKLRSRPI